MSDTIKFKAIQNPTTKNIELQIYRPFNETNGNLAWVMVDHFNELTPTEFRMMGEYIFTIFNRKNNANNQTPQI